MNEHTDFTPWFQVHNVPPVKDDGDLFDEEV